MARQQPPLPPLLPPQRDATDVEHSLLLSTFPPEVELKANRK